MNFSNNPHKIPLTLCEGDFMGVIRKIHSKNSRQRDGAFVLGNIACSTKFDKYSYKFYCLILHILL